MSKPLPMSTSEKTTELKREILANIDDYNNDELEHMLIELNRAREEIMRAIVYTTLGTT